MENVQSINPVVGETNEGVLNAIRSRPITPANVHEALASASSDPVAEGTVGAGTGTRAFGWKGGSALRRRVPREEIRRTAAPVRSVATAPRTWETVWG